MRMRFSAVAMAAACACASIVHAGGKVPDPTPPGDDPGDDPTPVAFTPGEDAAAGQTGVGSTGVGLNAVPTTPAGTTTYATTLNGAIQGGFTTTGSSQAVSFQKVGQVFNSTGGTLNQLSFVDTNGAAGGEELRIALFDPTTFGIVGPTLYSSSVAALTSYGDKGGVNGVDALAYHTWSNINLLLAPGAQYYAYVVPTSGSNVFNGSNSRYTSGAYFFELATAPSALGGEMVFQFNNGEYRQVAGSPGAGPLQALYNISITPNATGVVPEPASWAMMIAGFGFIGGALRRRNVRTSVRMI